MEDHKENFSGLMCLPSYALDGAQLFVHRFASVICDHRQAHAVIDDLLSAVSVMMHMARITYTF